MEMHASEDTSHAYSAVRYTARLTCGSRMAAQSPRSACPSADRGAGNSIHQKLSKTGKLPLGDVQRPSLPARERIVCRRWKPSRRKASRVTSLYLQQFRPRLKRCRDRKSRARQACSGLALPPSYRVAESLVRKGVRVEPQVLWRSFVTSVPPPA